MVWGIVVIGVMGVYTWRGVLNTGLSGYSQFVNDAFRDKQYYGEEVEITVRVINRKKEVNGMANREQKSKKEPKKLAKKSLKEKRVEKQEKAKLRIF